MKSRVDGRSRVRVLAVDQSVEEKDGKKVVIGKTATIELDPQQAEMLALSRQLGTLSLTLRSILDSKSPTAETAEDRDDNNVSVNTVRYGVSAAHHGRRKISRRHLDRDPISDDRHGQGRYRRWSMILSS